MVQHSAHHICTYDFHIWYCTGFPCVSTEFEKNDWKTNNLKKKTRQGFKTAQFHLKRPSQTFLKEGVEGTPSSITSFIYSKSTCTIRDEALESTLESAVDSAECSGNPFVNISTEFIAPFEDI